MSKALLGIIPLIIVALAISFYMSYMTKIDELVYAKNENATLTHSNDQLRQSIQKNRQQIANLVSELQRTQEMLQNRELKLQELQNDVYAQIRQLEEYGKKDHNVLDILRRTIPDGLWAEIFGRENCGGNPSSQNKSARRALEAIPGANTQEQDRPSPD